MLLAVKKAREGIKKGQAPFGACIVKKGRVVSLAHNIVWKSTDITAHAEVNAIRIACKKLKSIDLSGCVIYSTCEPCPMCFSACHWSGISKIIFGANIKDAKKFGFSELEISCKKMKRAGRASMQIKGNFLRQKNIELFQEWFEQKDKRVY